MLWRILEEGEEQLLARVNQSKDTRSGEGAGKRDLQLRYSHSLGNAYQKGTQSLRFLGQPQSPPHSCHPILCIACGLKRATKPFKKTKQKMDFVVYPEDRNSGWCQKGSRELPRPFQRMSFPRGRSRGPHCTMRCSAGMRIFLKVPNHSADLELYNQDQI